MALQKEILTVKKDGSTPEYIDATGTKKSDKTLQGGVGVLALGKAGDVVTRAYGPVARAYKITSATPVEFGTFVEKQGILVNPGDCVGISGEVLYPFDTKTLKNGQVGTFLVSGACIVKKSQVAAIQAKMKVQYLSEDYASAANDDVVEIEVNGFDSDVA